jgi:hypothetical protein
MIRVHQIYHHGRHYSGSFAALMAIQCGAHIIPFVPGGGCGLCAL